MVKKVIVTGMTIAFLAFILFQAYAVKDIAYADGGGGPKCIGNCPPDDSGE